MSDWLDRVRIGDVLRTASGTERVVREVHRWRSRHGTNAMAVAFAIMHCSWTGQCYTVYNHNDLRTMGYRPTGHRVRLNRPIDRKIARAIALHDGRRAKSIATCCTVSGVR